MDVNDIAVAIALLLLAYRVPIFIYRFYFHPLAKFPGPRLAAVSTLYRAYYQCWKDGQMLHQTTKLHKIYGPVIRISPNELTFCTSAAYNDIFSNNFNGIKDPDYYSHLVVQAETFFSTSDSTQHRARFRPVSSLFSKKHYDRCEPNIQQNVEHFSELISVNAKLRQPCNLALGYRSLFLRIVNDFTFSSVPDPLRSLASENFDDSLCLSTARGINWTLWLARNFPRLSVMVYQIPLRIRGLVTSDFDATDQINQIVEDLVRHEKQNGALTEKDCLLKRFMNAHLETKSESVIPLSDAVLESEALVNIWGGIIDPTNIASFGTFMVSQDSQLQQELYEEIKSVWADIDTSVPSYEVLRHLPLLNGVIKESMRLTHGVVTGPPRLVGPGGTRIDGYFVPAKAVVAAPSYFVHMDPEVYPNPHKFDPGRWINNDHPGPLVVFSKGRRKCPAAHFSYMEIFATFATVFRRFRVTPYETCIEDFEWREYFSINFTGRPLRAIMESRVD